MRPGLLAVVLLVVASLSFLPLPVTGNPECGSTLTENTTLTGDLVCPSGTVGLYIGAPITLECSGFSISGDGPAGIKLDSNGATVRDCAIRGFDVGFDLVRTGNNTFVGNSVKGIVYGFFIDGSDNSVQGNTVLSAVYGFYLSPTATWNTLSANNASNGMIGFDIFEASHNLLSSNWAYNNTEFGFSAGNLSASNSLVGNVADPNRLDFHDLSHGTGSHGTANHYRGNSCDSGSYPSGLCVYSFHRSFWRGSSNFRLFRI